MRLASLMLAVLGVVCCVSTIDAAPIDLNTWSQEGPPANGNWTVQGGGTSVFQSINGLPTFFVSPNNFLNTTFEGKFGVETGVDDDFIGFVFGYQNDMEFFLFDWKQGNQPPGAQAGFTLAKVTGGASAIPFPAAGQAGDHQVSGPGYQVLATDIGTGWDDNTVYDFALTYQTNRIKIDIAGGVFGAGQTIFDIAPGDIAPSIGPSFPNGRFGFYNFSQQAVRYQGFEQEAAPVPEPTSLAIWSLLGLAGAGYRWRKRNARPLP